MPCRPHDRPYDRPLFALAAALTLGVSLGMSPGAAPAQASSGTHSPTDAGAYLSSREAGLTGDFAASAGYLTRLLASDPANPALRERLIMAHLGMGRFAEAAEVAGPLISETNESPAAALAVVADAFVRGDFDAVLALQSRFTAPPRLFEGLGLAWAHLGQGRMTEALAALDPLSDAQGMGPFALYCRALMLALVGDAEGALAIFEDPANGVRDALNRRGTVAYVQLLGLVERFDDALAVIDEAFGGATDPQVTRLSEAYAARRPLPFDLISGPADGMAEVFAVLAAANLGNPPRADALFYAQAAVAINPRLSDAQIIIGQFFEATGFPDLAADAYGRIAADDGFSLVAAMGLSQTLEAQGDFDAAVAVLDAARLQHPDNPVTAQLLGDMLRRANRHEEAVSAYTEVLAAVEAAGGSPDWRLWFARAVSFERTGQWPQAEADFRAALQIEPDQPTVLNYLGYSLVERGENLAEALDMIERAVAGEPDSGYIIDSLAWALYRLGRYNEAVPPMERAVALLPTDPILNDHLGDIYWAVGRHREARFQWRRALSFGPHDDLDMDLVRRKIEHGLDADGASPNASQGAAER